MSASTKKEALKCGLSDDQIVAMDRINNLVNKAIRSWERYAGYPDEIDNSGKFYEKALTICQSEAAKLGFTVEFDYPGLYPTFEIIRVSDNKHFCEYNTLGFFKRINGFYG